MSTSTHSINKNGTGVSKTYIFIQNEQMPSAKFKSNIWQILPAVTGSCMCLPFGIMFGWPSPTYPKLLSSSSPVPISIDQSAVIAGCLMIGNILGTPLSSWSFLGNKYGMSLGCFSMLIGWILMWLADSIYFLMGSRFLIGLGFGYGVGQLKLFIRELCEPKLAVFLTKCINFYVFLGVIVAFVLGYFLNFRDFSIVGIGISGLVFTTSILLPHSPKEYLRFGKTRKARKLLSHIKPNSDIDYEMQLLQMSLLKRTENMTLFQMLKFKELRNNFAIITLLMFFMQFSGAPATMIYNETIFTSSGVAYSKFCAISYSVLYFISNFIGVFYLGNLNKKNVLVLSSLSVTACLVLNVAVMFFDFNSKYWSYSTLVSMSLFIFCHSTGMAVVPFLLTQEYFPVSAIQVVTHIQIMQHSAMGLLITKIFQVLYVQCDLYVSFCLFACVSFVSIFFDVIFLSSKTGDTISNNNLNEKPLQY